MLGHCALETDLFREASETSIDEALFYFDGFLVAIVGALDATARVAAQAYGLRGSPGWRRSEWRTKLRSADPAFVAALTDHSSIRAVVDAISTLRNLVHDEPLKIVGTVRGYQVTEYLAAIARADRQPLLRAVDALGGAEHWGLDESKSEFPVLDLGRFTEVALPKVVETLNELMRLTAVERFGVDAQPPFGPSSMLAREAPHFRILGGL